MAHIELEDVFTLLRNFDRTRVTDTAERDLEAMARALTSTGELREDANKSTKALKNMPKEHTSQQDEQATCTICIDSLRNAAEIPPEHKLAESLNSAKETIVVMPCKHRYHQFCLTVWLEREGTCPTCRTKLKTDKEYEAEERRANLEELHNSMFS